MKVGLKEKKNCKKINGSMLSFYIVDEIQFFFVQGVSTKSIDKGPAGKFFNRHKT